MTSKKLFFKSKYLLFFSISIFIIILDQVSKFFAKSLDGTVLIPNFLTWTYVLNTGAAFGMLKGGKFILGIVSLMVALGILWYLYKGNFKTIILVSLSFIFGGALGNAYDRLFRIGVIDFFNLGWYPVFNIADSFIVIGVVILIVDEVMRSLRK